MLIKETSSQNSKGNCSKLKTQEFFLPPSPRRGRGICWNIWWMPCETLTPVCNFPYHFKPNPNPITDLTFARSTDIPRFTPDIPTFNSKVHKPYPKSKQHGSKTIFFSATQTDTARIRRCPPPPSPGFLPSIVHFVFLDCHSSQFCRVLAICCGLL